jgi:hypothetical protein
MEYAHDSGSGWEVGWLETQRFYIDFRKEAYGVPVQRTIFYFSLRQERKRY